METEKIDLKDAIEISRIISRAPEERLPMILSVFERADLTIDGLEEIEAWAVCKDRNNIVDASEFAKMITEKFADTQHEDEYRIPASEFTKFCSDNGMDARAVRSWLARKKIIETDETGKGVKYTVLRKVSGKTVRCIVIKKENI